MVSQRFIIQRRKQMGNTKNMGNVAVTENVDDMEDTV